MIILEIFMVCQNWGKFWKFSPRKCNFSKIWKPKNLKNLKSLKKMLQNLSVPKLNLKKCKYSDFHRLKNIV